MSQTGILTKAKKKFIGDKAFYRYLIFLAFPMIVQNGITSFVSFLDNIMVGQIGTEPMSLEASPVQVFSVRSFSEKETLRDRNIPSVSNCTPVC